MFFPSWKLESGIFHFTILRFAQLGHWWQRQIKLNFRFFDFTATFVLHSDTINEGTKRNILNLQPSFGENMTCVKFDVVCETHSKCC